MANVEIKRVRIKYSALNNKEATELYSIKDGVKQSYISKSLSEKNVTYDTDVGGSISTDASMGSFTFTFTSSSTVYTRLNNAFQSSPTSIGVTAYTRSGNSITGYTDNEVTAVKCVVAGLNKSGNAMKPTISVGIKISGITAAKFNAIIDSVFLRLSVPTSTITYTVHDLYVNQ